METTVASANHDWGAGYVGEIVSLAAELQIQIREEERGGNFNGQATSHEARKNRILVGVDAGAEQTSKTNVLFSVLLTPQPRGDVICSAFAVAGNLGV